MKDIWLMTHKEWTGFAKSDRWIFVIYGILVLAWSSLLSYNMHTLASGAGYLWLAFFSVIVSGNFLNTTFVAERMSGSLEILLTSGISRRSILLGKIAFIVLMSTLMGIICYCTAIIISFLRGEDIRMLLIIYTIWEAIMLYSAACFMNAACGAWLSVRVTNPRLLPFVNLFVLVLIVAIHKSLSYIFSLSLWSLVIALLVTGVVFCIFAFRDYKSERVIQPVVY